MTSHVAPEPPSAYSQKLRPLSDRANIDLTDNGVHLRGQAAVMPYGAFSKKDTRALFKCCSRFMEYKNSMPNLDMPESVPVGKRKDFVEPYADIECYCNTNFH